MVWFSYLVTFYTKEVVVLQIIFSQNKKILFPQIVSNSAAYGADASFNYS